MAQISSLTVTSAYRVGWPLFIGHGVVTGPDWSRLRVWAAAVLVTVAGLRDSVVAADWSRVRAWGLAVVVAVAGLRDSVVAADWSRVRAWPLAFVVAVTDFRARAQALVAPRVAHISAGRKRQIEAGLLLLLVSVACAEFWMVHTLTASALRAGNTGLEVLNGVTEASA